ncbi:glutathione S-transferase family protein [Shimia haliotis]|uniref:Glutathione S-transferase n=1 Tax=Shimia haliotis TaxID=1280847 RepID=A0A1I4B045_9RHOB|nr:glutathione S-transferase [Shimia haliotis]SFK61547.1 glutathione S-transferase [Shimia haliotis]
MIRLHHLNKSRSLRIMWLLEEIGADYELIAYHRDPKTRLAPPELKEIHPLGKSPVIEMNGRVISESAAIVERICYRHAPHMIPEAGTASYVQHLELMHFAEGSAMLPPLLGLYTSMLGEAAAPLQPRITSEMDNHFSYMDSLLRPSGHFVLDDLSAVDVMMIFPAEIAVRGQGAKAYPALARFVEAMHARPAFQRAKARDEG